MEKGKEKEKEKFKPINILPYLDAFLFFSNDESLKNQFKTIFINDPKDFSNYIKYIKYNLILIKNDDTEQKKEEKKIFQKYPNKAFDFLLDIFHKLFQDNQYDKKTNFINMNRDTAYNNFKNYAENNTSFISENFFGIKSIKKTCPDCKVTFYNFKYLKTIPIRVEDNKDKNELDLEKCIKKIQKTFIKEENCAICESKNMEIQIKIEEYPKIIILILYGQENYKIKKNFKQGDYELVALEYIKTKSIFDKLIGTCINNKNYCLIYDQEINHDIFESTYPIVLFYKKRQQMIILGKDSIASYETYNNTSKDSINNIVNMKDIDIKIPDEKKNIDITITFKFETNDKKIKIKTKNYEKFENIIKELKKQNEIKDLDNNKIFFNNEKINMDKTPKDYNISDNSYFLIKN